MLAAQYTSTAKFLAINGYHLVANSSVADAGDAMDATFRVVQAYNRYFPSVRKRHHQSYNTTFSSKWDEALT